MRKLFYLGLMLTLVVSCKEKEDQTPVDPSVVSDYMPMKTGNYWVYAHYDIDSAGNVTSTGRTDSVTITRDSMINGKQYFVFEGTNYPYNANWGIVDILRDSSGYLVNGNGIIRFSENNFTDILSSKTEVIGNDTLYTLNYKMERPSGTITVPAGVFGALNCKGTVTTTQNIPGIPNPRYLNTYYADNIGKIVETYFFLFHPVISEKRLVRYQAGTE